MYNGIGLQTPRGSGTNGYVQTNKFFVRSKISKVAMDGNKGFAPDQGTAGITKKPNKDILEHDRKRQIELKLVILEDKLVEQGYTDAEIADRLADARRNLEVSDAATAAEGGGIVIVSENRGSDTQTHQIAARKEKQMETLRAALGIEFPADEDVEFEEGEILRGKENKDNKMGRQMVGDVEAEQIDRSRDIKDTEKPAGGTDKFMEELQKKDAKKARHDNNEYSDTDTKGRHDSDDKSDPRSKMRRKKSSAKNILKKRHDSDSESDSTIGVRQKYTSSKITHEHSGAGAKKRHDSDSESDSSIDTGGRNSPAKNSRKTSGKKRQESESDSDVSIVPKRGNNRSMKTKRISDTAAKKRHDSDSESDSSIDTRERKKSGKKRQESESDSDVSIDPKRGNNRSMKTKRISDTAAKKRHDSDSESDSSIDTRGRYSPAKIARKTYGTSAKKRHNSDADTNVNIDPNRRYSSSKKNEKISDAGAKKRHDSDSEGDLDKGTRRRFSKKTTANLSDDRFREQEASQNLLGRKKRKEYKSSDTETDERLGSGSGTDDSEKEHRRGGKLGRSGRFKEPKVSSKLENQRWRGSASSDSDPKNRYVALYESDSDVEINRLTTSKKSMKTKHENSHDSDFDRDDAKKPRGGDHGRYLNAHVDHRSAGMSEYNDKLGKKSQHAEKDKHDPESEKLINTGGKRTSSDKDRKELSGSHRIRRSDFDVDDQKSRSEREYKRSFEGSRNAGLDTGQETRYKRSVQGRSDWPGRPDSNDDGTDVNRKDIVDRGVKGRKHDSGSPEPNARVKQNDGKLKNTELEDESRRYRSRFESNDGGKGGKTYHDNEDPKEEWNNKEHGNNNRNKYKDEELKEGRNKEHVDDASRSKYRNDGDHKKVYKVEEEHSYRSYKRADETPVDGIRKRVRKEEPEDRGRRDERDRDVSKRGRYDDSQSRDRRYDSDRHDRERSRR
ncbi:hypothetical protein Dimus_020851 [Dionaea muscipula]